MHPIYVRRFERNAVGRDFVVGDIHGCFSLLDAELTARQFDPTRDRLFSVGDLIDRGAESLCLLDAVGRHGIHAVRGNHEQALLDWVQDRDPDTLDTPTVMQAIAGSAYADGLTQALISHGGQWFMDLYRSDDDDAARMRQDIVRYFTLLPWAIEIETPHGRIGIVHADAPNEQWSNLTRELEMRNERGCDARDQVLWDRRRWKNRELSTHIGGVTAVIVGHSPTYEIAQRGNVINIDTGAAYGNKLTVLDLADVPALLSRGDHPVTGKPK
ncbi:metallophosphoesterase [Burkholderia vietnamiensis]|uniref:metallophosphoesterase n=1 Tax=Burkholderia vietnamiensis TaxID=60552 RepID=UPI00158D4806|nr:metallophosphoesterase [Burkholderia vietnamiensis]